MSKICEKLWFDFCGGKLPDKNRLEVHKAYVQERYGHLIDRAVGQECQRFETRKGNA